MIQTRLDKFLNKFKKSNADRAVTEAGGYDRENETLAQRMENTPARVLSMTPEQASKAYVLSPEATRCLQIKCNALSTIPLEVVYTNVSDPGTEIKRLDGPLYDLINYPNPKLTRSELIWRIYAWLDLVGDAFIVMEQNLQGDLELYVLNSIYVTIVPDSDTGEFGIVYKPHGFKKALFYPNSVVCHIKDFNPLDHWNGAGKMMVAGQDIKARLAASKDYTVNFERGNLSAGILTVPQNYGPDQIKLLKKDWNNRNEKSSRLLVLKKDQEEFKENLTNAHTIKANEVINTSINGISMAFGVPVSLLNPVLNNEWDKAEAFMMRYTILPEGTRIAECLTNAFAKNVNTKQRRFQFKFNFGTVAVLDMHKIDKTRVDTAQSNTGRKTFNEQRIADGEKPYVGELAEFGDTPYPVWQAKQAALQADKNNTSAGKASDSLSLPGSIGGRDQSSSGETAMIDETAKR